MDKKAYRKFVKMVEAEGLTVVQGGNKHHKVLDNSGKLVSTVSHTGETNAFRQAVRDLARQGLFKDEKQARATKF